MRGVKKGKTEIYTLKKQEEWRPCEGRAEGILQGAQEWRGDGGYRHNESGKGRTREGG